MHRKSIIDLLKNYSLRHPTENIVCEAFIDFVNQHQDCFERSLLIGHVTGSAWIIDVAKKSALLTHHRKLDVWFQLGGHADGDSDIFAVALKEAQEESGLEKLRPLSDQIFDIDIHIIPEHKGVPAHEHFDVRFIFSADSEEQLIVSAESKDLAWIPLAEMHKVTSEPSIQRMVEKSRSFLPPV